MSDEAANSIPPVDVAALMRRCMNDADFARKTLERFSQRVDEDCKTFEIQIAGHQFTELHRLAHELRVAAAHVAANPLKRICFELEQAGIRGNSASFPAIHARLNVECQRFTQYLPEAFRLIRETKSE